jgi:hypothetical protein
VQVHRKRMRVSATLVALALAMTACGGSDDEEPNATETQGAEAETGGTYSVQINDPENPLIPGNTTESEGNQVLKALFTPLVGYDLDTTEVTYDAVAESIESEDNKVWTVTLKDGWTFHDGTPVTAESFVKSWNYTANAENAQGASYFFSNIEGYSSEAPTAEMSGLEVVDETSFTVTLAKPFAQFPVATRPSPRCPSPSSRTPRRSARPRSATARSRPTASSSRRRASPSPATRTTPVRTSRSPTRSSSGSSRTSTPPTTSCSPTTSTWSVPRSRRS